MPINPHVFPLGPWTPDSPALSADGVIVATNCVPTAYGYAPIGEYVVDTSALAARARGAILSRDETDAVVTYAGDISKLYRNVGGTWTDSSKVGGYAVAEEDNWEFVRWRDQVFATNYFDNPQKITLGGSIFSDLTTALRIKHWAVVRSFVMGGWTEDSVDGEVPWRARWCAFNDPTDWAPDPATLADYEDLAQKKIQRVFGGEQGIFMQDTAITRATFVGSPVVFQFDEVISDVGLIAPGAAVQLGDRIYFLSERGFYELVAGSQIKPIGVGKVDKTVLTDLDTNYLHRMTASVDPNSNRVVFGYPGAGNVDGQPNKIVVYDPTLERWSEIEQVHELLWVGAGAATTLEDLDVPYPDLDAMDISLDSPRWIGGNEQLAMFDSTHMSGFFDGPPRTATITTREYMFDGEQRVRLRGFRPMVRGDAVSISARVGRRNDIALDPTYTDPATPNAEGGRVRCRTNARFHRIELSVGGNWEEAFGVMVEGRDLGPGGRRG
jgi:hypothetical protein